MAPRRLIPCLTCARHVRESDVACPFCGADTAESIASAAPMPRLEGRPLTRAAILFAATTSAAAVGACGKSPAEPDANTVVQPYGVPVPQDSGPPPNTIVAPYGVPMPPPDAGIDSGKKHPPTTQTEPPVSVPAYGVPPPSNLTAPAYGVPPPSKK